MRFFVTYCAMDQQLANPLWHACLILSYWPGQGEKIEVTNAWGFYAAPMANPDSRYNKIKKKFGFAFDFKGNYGHLQKEEVRFLDLGYGLRGVTFEISLEQFVDLKRRCRARMAVETKAINEAKERLEKKGIVPTSIDIFREEQRCAIEENRPSRLGPFGFNYSLMKGFEESNTCKTGALQLLRDIGIEKEKIDALVPNNRYVAFPRISGGQLEQCHLHSDGPLQKHVSNRTGKVNFFRAWEKQGTKVFWTLPPQFIVTENPEVSDYFSIPQKYADAGKRLIRQLQSIEHELRNAKLPAELEDQRQEMVKCICDLYGAFATLNSRVIDSDIVAKIVTADNFLNNLYLLVNNEGKKNMQFSAVTSHLHQEVKEKICDLMGLELMQKTASPVYK